MQQNVHAIDCESNCVLVCVCVCEQKREQNNGNVKLFCLRQTC